MSGLLYFIIALIIFIVTLTNSFINDADILFLQIIIGDIAEALIVSICWIVSVPILVVSNILIAIVDILDGDEE